MAKRPAKTNVKPTKEAAPDPADDAEDDDSDPNDPGGAAALRERAVMSGGPGEEEADLVSIKLGDRTFQVPAEMAEAYNAEVGRFSTEIEKAKKTGREAPPARTDDTPPKKDAVVDEEDLTTLIFTDTKKAIAKITETVRADLTKSYQEEQTRSAFWGDLEAENPELKGRRTLVTAVMQEHWNDLKDLKGKDAREKVAELTREEILSLSNQFNKGKSRAKGAAETLEGASTGARRPSGSDEDRDNTPRSLSAALKARKTKRRESSELMSE